MKSVRLFALLDHLRAARRPVSADTLAQRLGVSTRTIYRDIASLQATGAPVRGESGLGYQLEKGYFLPPLHFDPEEMEAIMLGLRMLGSRRGGGLNEAAERVAGKVAAVLGPEEAEKFRNLKLLAVTRPKDSDFLAARWGSLVRLAIREHRIMLLDYRSLEGHDSQRHIHPLGLTLFDDAWLLTAWCESRQDFRNFRLDMIKSLKDTSLKFHPQKGQLFRDYLASLQHLQAS